MTNNIRELTLAQIQTLCEGASHMDDLLILTDHFPRTPLSSPVRMGYVMISLCISGMGHYTINAKDYEFKPHDFLLLSEGQILTGYHVSDDFSGLSFIVSPELTEEIIKGVQNLSQLFMFFRALFHHRGRTHPLEGRTADRGPYHDGARRGVPLQRLALTFKCLMFKCPPVWRALLYVAEALLIEPMAARRPPAGAPARRGALRRRRRASPAPGTLPASPEPPARVGVAAASGGRGAQKRPL